VSAPLRDGVDAVRQDTPAVYSCTDEPGGSGVATCVGSIALGEPLDTATAGAKELVVTATDNAGNSRTVRVPYSVEYLAVPLEVSLRCVELLPDNRLQAHYNIVNRNPLRLRIPVGPDNEFLPGRRSRARCCSSAGRTCSAGPRSAGAPWCGTSTARPWSRRTPGSSGAGRQICKVLVRRDAPPSAILVPGIHHELRAWYAGVLERFVPTFRALGGVTQSP